MCGRGAGKVLSKWLDESPIGAIAEARETRLGLTALGGVVEVKPDTTAKLVFTGQADVIISMDAHALVIDYKTGRGDYDSAETNSQLRALAYLVHKHLRVDSARVALVQPWVGQPTVADFDAETLKQAGQYLHHVLAESRKPDAPLIAGDHCKFCPALADCPAVREKAIGIAHRHASGLPDTPKEARAKMFGRAMHLPAAEHAQLVKEMKLLELFRGAVLDAAKEKAGSDPEFQQFYRLKKGVVREKVTNVQLVFERLSAMGIDAPAFADACTVTKDALKELLADRLGLKGKALTDAMSLALDGATEKTESAQQLEEVE
jgi:hypothetical protein